MSSSVIKYITFCRSKTGGKACIGKGRCTFAHSIDEVNPLPCRYQEQCRYMWSDGRKCEYIHEGESKKTYAFRLGYIQKSRMINKPNTCHQGIYNLSALEYSRIIINKLKHYEPIDTTTNKGANIMRKWGWEDGKGLGKELNGVVEIILPTCLSKNSVKMSKVKQGLNKPIKFVSCNDK